MSIEPGLASLLGTTDELRVFAALVAWNRLISTSLLLGCILMLGGRSDENENPVYGGINDEQYGRR